MHPETLHTAVSDDPKDNNFLSPINFKFTLKRAPTLNFFLQKISFPGVSISPIEQSTPFVTIYQPGDKIVFNPLQVTFRVDENMKNYMEIYRWIMALGEEESLRQYEKLQAKPIYSGEGVVSDITVTILDSAKNPNYTFYFHDCFPFALSDMSFDVTPNSITHQVATTRFRYTNWTLEKVR